MTTPRYILDFIEAVYPGNAELALASFNERKAIMDATALIKSLRQKEQDDVIRLKAQLCKYSRMLIDAADEIIELKTTIVSEPSIDLNAKTNVQPWQADRED